MNDRYVLKMLFLFLVFSSLFIIIEAGQDMDWYWYIIYCWTGILHTGLVYYILDWYIIYWTGILYTGLFTTRDHNRPHQA